MITQILVKLFAVEVTWFANVNDSRQNTATLYYKLSQ